MGDISIKSIEGIVKDYDQVEISGENGQIRMVKLTQKGHEKLELILERLERCRAYYDLVTDGSTYTLTVKAKDATQLRALL